MIDALREVFQIRVELEALAAQIAAAVAEPRRIGRFEATIRPIYDDRPRGEDEHLAEDGMFHEAVLALGGNSQLREISHRLNTPVIMSQSADVLAAELLEEVREHRVIAAAIFAGDPPAAAAAMRAHLQRAAALALAAN